MSRLHQDKMQALLAGHKSIAMRMQGLDQANSKLLDEQNRQKMRAELIAAKDPRETIEIYRGVPTREILKNCFNAALNSFCDVDNDLFQGGYIITPDTYAIRRDAIAKDKAQIFPMAAFLGFKSAVVRRDECETDDGRVIRDVVHIKDKDMQDFLKKVIVGNPNSPQRENAVDEFLAERDQAWGKICNKELRVIAEVSGENFRDSLKRRKSPATESQR